MIFRILSSLGSRRQLHQILDLSTRPDIYPNLEVGIETEELARSSRMVSRLTGYPVQYNKAVVGRNAFAHEAGIHQHGVLNERTTYEIMDPSAVGQEGSKLVLGKHFFEISTDCR